MHIGDINPVTGVYTQNITSYWKSIKTKFKAIKGVRIDMLPGYLDELLLLTAFHSLTGEGVYSNYNLTI
jgi:hypothetical protein